MGRNQGTNSKKKEKIKHATHVPTSAHRQGPGTNPLIHAVKVKKLKITDTGFRVSDSSFHSAINAAIAAFTWKETDLSDSEMDVVWDQVHLSAGWDQGYVDSFVNQDKLPPENDPELPKAKTKEKGVRSSDRILSNLHSDNDFIGQSHARLDEAH
jgi:hypothetical protein